MNIQDVYSLVADERQAVDTLIEHRLRSEVELVSQIGHYIVNSGGKRLRPILLLLAARACGYEGDKHIDLAAVIEFIHTATLLHDDVVDASLLRRGNATANAVWGDQASVLVGDFLYSRSFQIMVEVGNMRVMEILSAATNTIAEGEVKQLLNVGDTTTDEARYLDVIRSKTAKLFESSCQIGAVLCHSSMEQEQALANYGMYLGTAYQLIDDVLDYSATSDELGKNIGDDLAEGKPTLPLIYAMQSEQREHAEVVRQAIESRGKGLIEEVTLAIESTGAIKYTAQAAKKEAEMAIAALEIIPESPYKKAMIDLARFSVARSY